MFHLRSLITVTLGKVVARHDNWDSIGEDVDVHFVDVRFQEKIINLVLFGLRSRPAVLLQLEINQLVEHQHQRTAR